MKSRSNALNRLRAFSLIELLVTTACIALLMAIILPSLSRARSITRGTVCLSNLRQMMIAAQAYLHTQKGYYPFSQWSFRDQNNPANSIEYLWDFVVTPSSKARKPGLLWQAKTDMEIQQCPSFTGEDNYGGDPYTGYNYNRSYIGGVGYQRGAVSKILIATARESEIRRPHECAVFGDGEYERGANKFMRSPYVGKDFDLSYGRWAGTQGFRHLNKTNVAFADGHARPWKECYEPEEYAEYVFAGTGFLTPDNRLYDLD